jgi:hypothetical protein
VGRNSRDAERSAKLVGDARRQVNGEPVRHHSGIRGGTEGR